MREAVWPSPRTEQDLRRDFTVRLGLRPPDRLLAPADLLGLRTAGPRRAVRRRLHPGQRHRGAERRVRRGMAGCLVELHLRRRDHDQRRQRRPVADVRRPRERHLRRLRRSGVDGGADHRWHQRVLPDADGDRQQRQRQGRPLQRRLPGADRRREQRRPCGRGRRRQAHRPRLRLRRRLGRRQRHAGLQDPFTAGTPSSAGMRWISTATAPDSTSSTSRCRCRRSRACPAGPSTATPG